MGSPGNKLTRSISPVAIAVAASLLASQAPLAAQDTVTVGERTPSLAGQELLRAVAERIIDFHNRPSTVRFSGRTHMPAGTSIEGDVAVLGGPVLLGGAITGDLVVVNADITLEPGARVGGDLTVVGGLVFGEREASVEGTITTYASILRYRRVGDQIEYRGTDRPRPPPSRTRLALPDWTLGDSEIYVSARAYNRVEGLPIAFGPRLTTGGRNPLRFEAFIVWRSESGFDVETKDLGYEVRLKQWFFGHRDVWLETAFWSINDPIESWQLTNLENSLALFLFRRDYRDYYERQGFYARIGANRGPGFLRFEIRDENHRTRESGTPWTILFHTDEDLQANAAITHLFLDLRRFNRVSFSSVLGLRLVLGGRAGGGSLPAQRQHVIGGAGTLPGYGQREFDCGARLAPSFGETPAYGCERFALFQAEFRTGLDFRFRWDDRYHGDRSLDEPSPRDLFSIDFEPTIVMFWDAGTAWNTRESYFDHLTDTDNWSADIGGGVDLGGVGLYLAYPLDGPGGLEAVVRLTERF